jgi:hypothetical protein
MKYDKKRHYTTFTDIWAHPIDISFPGWVKFY